MPEDPQPLEKVWAVEWRGRLGKPCKKEKLTRKEALQFAQERTRDYECFHVKIVRARSL